MYVNVFNEMLSYKNNTKAIVNNTQNFQRK